MSAPSIEIRRVWTQVETICHEFGPPPDRPLRRGVIAVVLSNPYAGRYEPDILPMMDALKPLGADMAGACSTRWACRRSASRATARARSSAPPARSSTARCGTCRAATRCATCSARHGVPTKAIVPSTKKVGGPGTRLDVPITHVNASYVRSHFDAIEVGVPGHPHADELVFILAMTTGARIHARVGGLAAADVTGRDGLR